MNEEPMTGLVVLMAMLFSLSPAFARDTGQQENVPFFTNEDLEKYGGKPSEDRQSYEPKNEKVLSRTERHRDAGTILKENSSAVVAIASYDDRGVLFSHGSGFVIRPDGAVVTSFHVISNASEIRIKAGRKVFPVKGVLFVDRESDIAILKAEGSDFPAAATLGDSDAAGDGEKVYVMGNPQGEQLVVSEGMLVGSREFGNHHKVFQITAPFSEGVSGGPVFNKYGEVIGIATFVLRESLGSQGPQSLNFALPVNVIKEAVAMERIIDLKDLRTEEPERTAQHWLDLGNRLNRSGRYEEATDAYRRAVDLDPGLAGAFNGLGLAYMRLKKYQDAVKAYQQALRIEPDSAWIYSNLGLVYMESGMDAQAIDALTQAVRIMPELGAAHFNLGLTYRRLGMYRQAAEAYRNAVRANPGSAEAHFHLGIMYMNLNERDAALEQYEMLKDIDPSLADRLFNMLKR